MNSSNRRNTLNYDMDGNVDIRVKYFNIREKRLKCPLCNHCEPILTLAHIMNQHDVSIEEAKKIRETAKVVQPFKERGEKLNEQAKIIRKNRKGTKIN